MTAGRMTIPAKLDHHATGLWVFTSIPISAKKDSARDPHDEYRDEQHSYDVHS
jgi:hypothetical protein